MTRRGLMTSAILAAFVVGVLTAHQVSVLYGQPKGLTYLQGYNVSVRSSTEGNFTENTRKFGVEVVKDESTGNLIYVSETGSLAVVPAK